MLSTLDWALIEMWKEAGAPLEAVLRGIDDAFDKHDAKAARAKARVRRVNGLAWCAQSVMEAVSAVSERGRVGGVSEPKESGFESGRVKRFLEQSAAQVEGATMPAAAEGIQRGTTARLRELADLLARGGGPTLEEIDRTLTVLEERMFSALIAATSEEVLVRLREQAARELAPYRGKMQAVQIRQVQQQILQKRLLGEHRLPRLSLFYMSHGMRLRIERPVYGGDGLGRDGAGRAVLVPYALPGEVVQVGEPEGERGRLEAVEDISK